MKTPTFSTAFVALLASAVTAMPAAVPAADEASTLEARGPTIGVYKCQAYGWGSPCNYKRYSTNKVCYNIASTDPYYQTISAFGTDQYEGGCAVFTSVNCKENSAGTLQIGYPGYASFSGDVGNWNDKIRSFVCWEAGSGYTGVADFGTA